MDDGLKKVDSMQPGHGFTDVKIVANSAPVGLDLGLNAEAGYKATNWSIYGFGEATVNPYTRTGEFGVGAGFEYNW